MLMKERLSLGIDLLEMTTIENKGNRLVQEKSGIYLLEMTTTENQLLIY